MTRRLAQATEDALLTGGIAGRRAIEQAGFDEDLRNRLLAKVASAKFASEHASSLSEAGLDSSGHSRIPNSAGQGTRSIAFAQHWTGEESTEDAVLRMLNDAHKPLSREARGKAKIPTPVVDMRIKGTPKVSAGRRVASAREKAQAYADITPKDTVGLTAEEREELRKEFRERFTPIARAMPNTITGLAALANERIENAIARGQFKNIPRGKGVERDTRADNPFIDTVSPTTPLLLSVGCGAMIDRMVITDRIYNEQNDQAPRYRAALDRKTTRAHQNGRVLPQAVTQRLATARRADDIKSRWFPRRPNTESKRLRPC